MKTADFDPGFEHADLFREFCITHNVMAAAGHYGSCMKRLVKILQRRLGPLNVRGETDIDEILLELDDPTLNRGHIRNFRSVLRKYVQMVRSNFKGRFDSIVAPGIDVDVATLPARIRMEVSRIVRDTATARKLKRLYEDQCQICGLKLELTPGEFYIEAHHLKPLGQPHNGPDMEENIVCACPNCHVLLDYGALLIGPKTLKVCLHKLGKQFTDYHNDRCR